MKAWLGSCLFTLFALTLNHTFAQDFELDSDRLINTLETMEKRRPPAELFGKRDAPSIMPGVFGREIRRTRELFGKRQAYPLPSIRYLNDAADVPAKRRARELFGKRSVDMNPLTNEQMEILANMLMDRPRRARGGELFG